MNLNLISQACGSAPLQIGADVFKNIAHDTRKDLRGSCFIALAGENHDAHDFIADAIQKGATGVIYSREIPLVKGITYIRVADTLIALQNIAKLYRQQFSVPMLALTGSNGKTTTKEFTAQILQSQLQTHYSKGSFNNHFGLPFSILELQPEHQVGIFELGMNHFGEIQNLTQILAPTAVTCTMVGRAHIEFFGSESEIAKAKSEIYRYAPETALRIYNLDNVWTQKMRDVHAKSFPKSQMLSFSNSDAKADVLLSVQQATFDGMQISGHIQGENFAVETSVFGIQNSVNLAAAAALALSAGLAPKKVIAGLSQCRTIWGRNQFLTTPRKLKVLFDAYNANPDSMRALLENMNQISFSGNIYAVFGQMAEQGNQSASAHRELGTLTAESKVKQVLFFGSEFANFESGFAEAPARSNAVPGICQSEAKFSEAAFVKFISDAGVDDLLIIKGSRSAELERCLPLLGIDMAATRNI